VLRARAEQAAAVCPPHRPHSEARSGRPVDPDSRRGRQDAL
jgi:hypothetical protein